MTVARMQQAMTVILLTAACTWAGVTAFHDRTILAAAGAAAILFGYSGVLALELVWMTLVNRAAGCRPRVAQLLTAWWGEVCTAPVVFCWRQPFRARSPRDHLPGGTLGRRGVVFVHGYVCNRGLWKPWLECLKREGTPFVAVNLEPVFGTIDAYVKVIDTAVRQLEQLTGMAPVAVAHSMGGLAVRRWWVEQGNSSRIHHAVTIGSPHAGTRLARWAVSRNAVQMREGSHWLRQLREREPALHAARMTCYWSCTDNIVFPARTATMPNADNRALHGCAHVEMVGHPEPRRRLAELLRASTGLLRPQPIEGQGTDPTIS